MQYSQLCTNSLCSCSTLNILVVQPASEYTALQHTRFGAVAHQITNLQHLHKLVQVLAHIIPQATGHSHKDLGVQRGLECQQSTVQALAQLLQQNIYKVLLPLALQCTSCSDDIAIDALGSQCANDCSLVVCFAPSIIVHYYSFYAASQPKLLGGEDDGLIVALLVIKQTSWR